MKGEILVIKMNNNEIEIRVADLEDIFSIYEISTLCFPISWSITSIKGELTSNTHARYVVAVENDIVVGFAGLWIIVDEGHVTNIAVHPDFRRKGIGTLLMDKLMFISKNENLIGLTLEVRKSNLSAQNLYKQFGFIEEGVRRNYYSDNGEDAIIMWKHYI
ncbi:ribosomal protein S18-alanine N-acetyltransferase [Clostridium sp. HMP27]|uniref:ribosomal protein S18-alanine N-acetyltransferase n=1 Tax=Clostridium sp. HMP27 TaxID=1487921 RepID=UPI0025BB4871|nr:ribosomal protein S18-alanine N-acetyltransferase [Clostridium sp. HMP27]